MTAPWEKPRLLVSQFCRTAGPSGPSFTSISSAPGGFFLPRARGGLCKGFFSLPQVYENLQLFVENKGPGAELFDRLTTASLNKHLQDLMDGLTAKVFRTCNASLTLQGQLRALTRAEDGVAAKILSYNRANRAVAVLCNHQRATPKTFEKSMQTLRSKIEAKVKQVAEAKAELKKARADHRSRGDSRSKRQVSGGPSPSKSRGWQ
ncbi:hypothetical protein J1605_013921 [Eschrichtius robustus]|uniref:DNA topoisomerase I eukaryotic-type domain-containing protein n=1 Tax=Eschrichtius robustus TaxID=9764 RepID=A0AB34GDM8_ESCRO|nr:hypothetical protein J1605_013921 [Eschrichtius robustus]